MISRRRFQRSLAGTGAALLLAASANAQSSGASGSASVTKQLRAVRVSTPVRLDGRLDETAWQSADFAAGFLQQIPNEGAPATAPTEAAIMLEDDALVVGARLRGLRAGDVRALVTRRDNESAAEQFVVSLDTYRDRRTAYSFGVTASGVRLDYYHPLDEEDERDYSFDPVWEAATQVDSAGWTLEMRIPLSQLRFNDAAEPVWGVNFFRRVPVRNEIAFWALVPRNEVGWASRFGELRGLEGVRSARRIELLPFVAASSLVTGDRHPSNPFDDGKNLATQAGADVRAGLGPNLTLEATINPDFGQVEADPAEVNLTVFETGFEERRPFFVEGSQLLRGRGASYFYSRRVGAPPRRLASGDFVDAPRNTTILGAAKLTGRLRSGLSVGALAAVTARERLGIFDTASRSRERILVQPRTAFGVTRLLQEFGEGSTAGVILTGSHRHLGDDPRLTSAFNRYALTGGADWNLRLRDGEYVVSGDIGVSHIAGEPLAIVAAQRSSARYFQRPDADHLEVDSSRTSLTGFRGRFAVGRQSGRHWLWQLETSTQSPGFELNDAGRSTSVDDFGVTGRLTYRETRPSRLLRDYEIEVFGTSTWNYDGVFQSNELPGVFANFTFLNFWSLDMHYHYRASVLDPRLTRGGPLMSLQRNQHFSASLEGDPAPRFTWEAGFDHYIDGLAQRRTDLEVELGYRASERWQFRIEPSYSRWTDPRQYVTTLNGGRSETFDRRYLFAFIDRRELSAQIWLNYFFSPELSLETYAEPFTSSGRYYGFGELLRPRTLLLREYGVNGTTITRNDDEYDVTDGAAQFSFENPDFGVRSFRSNLVLRWEWRPGSTLFVVWQQDRESEDSFARRVTAGSLANAISAPGDNLFAIKVSYWLPVK